MAKNIYDGKVDLRKHSINKILVVGYVKRMRLVTLDEAKKVCRERRESERTERLGLALRSPRLLR